ncbi:MAG: amidase [Rhizomicrobium sp.]
MNTDEYQSYDATGLAQLVARKDVSPTELFEAALARVEQVNPAINAMVISTEDEARRAIADGLPDGPFRGVPFLLKDLTAHLKGTRMTSGSRLMKDFVSPFDSALTTAYKQAGFVTFGKVSTAEFGLLGVIDTDLFGTTRNPWDLQRSPGGSSGGSAAAVAARIAPAVNGSDAGGSIRIPAACCGCFGFKPSRGRVSMAPMVEGLGGLTTSHVVTRSVRDSAAILDLSCAPQPGDFFAIEPPPTPFAREVERSPGKLRFGMLLTNVYGGAMDLEIVDAVKETARLLEDLGHAVEVASPLADLEQVTAIAGILFSSSVRAGIDAEVERRGWPLRDDELQTVTRMVYERGGRYSAREFARALVQMQFLARGIAPAFQKYDMLLTGTLGRMPVKATLAEVMGGGSFDLDAVSARFYDFGPNTQIFNITGQPAMSLPLMWTETGMPVGVQIVGQPAGEAALLALAGEIERARPWDARRPPEGPLRNGQASKVEAL